MLDPSFNHILGAGTRIFRQERKCDSSRSMGKEERVEMKNYIYISHVHYQTHISHASSHLPSYQQYDFNFIKAFVKIVVALIVA